MSQVKTEVYLSNWISKNQNGTLGGASTSAGHLVPYRVSVREQSGYGIVNVGARMENSNNINRATENKNGVIKEISLVGNIFLGYQGKVQSGFGIVNLRAVLRN